MLSRVQTRTLAVYTPSADILPGAEGGRIMTEAGEITQLVSGPVVRYVAALEFRYPPPLPRGNHYHQHKHETLYVVYGRLRGIFVDIDTAEQTTVELVAGDLVVIQPRCAHVFVPLAASRAIEFAPEPFDPADSIRFAITTTAPAEDNQ
jgi:mannose-6-phosphate isomerase-like protein (cupin superfamily)